jgi:hypothetical protein
MTTQAPPARTTARRTVAAATATSPSLQQFRRRKNKVAGKMDRWRRRRFLAEIDPHHQKQNETKKFGKKICGVQNEIPV